MIYDSNDREHRASRTRAPVYVDGDSIWFRSLMFEIVVWLFLLGGASVLAFWVVAPMITGGGW